MSEPIPIQSLEIIGYATVLPATMLPSVVPPVFRMKENTDIYLVPPYFINEGVLCNATAISNHEAIDLQGRDEITLFDQPINAKIGSEMWVDLQFASHYEHKDLAEKNLRDIASDFIGQAETALSENRLADAERFSSIALSANDRLPEPFAIKATVCELDKDSTGASLMRELAEPLITLSTFDKLVTGYTKIVREKHPYTPEPPLEATKFSHLVSLRA